MIQTRPEKLHKLFDNPFLPEKLGDRQRKIGRRHAFFRPPLSRTPMTTGVRTGMGSAEHRRFGLDTADAPAEDTEPVDHRRVGVCADECIRKRERPSALILALHHTLREIFEIDLVTNAKAWRNDPKLFECALSQRRNVVALLIALEFLLQVGVQRVGRARLVQLNRNGRSRGRRESAARSFPDLFPERTIALRSAARSVMQGTPVKSWSRMRAGMNG